MIELGKLGCVTVTLSASMRQQAGVPDRWVCGPAQYGWACWLEAKGPEGKLLLDQKILIQRIRARSPSSAYVIREGGKQCSIEDHEGTVLAWFDGTAKDLSEKLAWLKARGR